MKKTTASLLAGMTALAFTAVTASAQTILFQETFENATVGEGPHTPNWGSWDTNSLSTHATNEYPDRSLEVASDPDGSVFGGGPNQYLRVRNGAHYHFGVDLRSAATSVITVSFDYIPRTNTIGSNRWLNLQFYGEVGEAIFTNNNRLHVTGIQANNQTLRDTDGTSFLGAIGSVTRFDIILNNSTADVSHWVNGSEITLASGNAAVWVNGETHIVDYNPHRILADSIGMNIAGLSFLQDSSTNRSSYDLDNITIFDGAHVGEVIPEPSTYALIFGGIALGGTLYIRRRRERVQK